MTSFNFSFNCKQLTTKLRSPKVIIPLIAAFIQLIGMICFAISFFSAEEVLFSSAIKEQQTNRNHFDQQLIADQLKLVSYCHQYSSREKPVFNKMVLIIIDALRADFIPSVIDGKSRSASMPFTESLLSSHGISMISEASTPTVTLPRIKSIISGQLPSFMDYILNLSAYQFKGENLIENAWKNGKKIVFYGDDTWLHLFPEKVFHRSNGTSSFFATDYIQVDTNVTYNVEKELAGLGKGNELDFDVMILHYLGVDHIGHSHGGAYSKLMPKKLIEMDQVVKTVYERVALEDEPYLFVIAGDHGMTDVGNHGGNTKEEVDTALIFISTKPVIHDNKKRSSQPSRVKQLDIASTLSSLLNLDLPNKSKGKLVLPVLKAMNMSLNSQLCWFMRNTLQISELNQEISAKFQDLLRKAIDGHFKFLEHEDEALLQLSINHYEEYVSKMQELLIISSTHYSFFSLLSLGLLLTIIPIVTLIWFEYKVNFRGGKTKRKNSNARNNSGDSIMFSPLDNNILIIFTYSCLALQILFLLSTSFVEAEHYYWHFISSTIIVLFLLEAIKNYMRNKPSIASSLHHLNNQYLIQAFICFLILLLLRITNYWNQINHANIGTWLGMNEHKRILSASVICSLVAISYFMSTKRFGKQQCLLISGLIWVYSYRSDIGTLSSFRIPFLIPHLHVSRNFFPQLVYFHVSLILFETFLKKCKFLKKFSFMKTLLSAKFLTRHLNLPSTTTKLELLRNKPSKTYSCLILRTLCTVWVLMSALLSKVPNIPLLAFNILLEKMVNQVMISNNDIINEKKLSNRSPATLVIMFTYSCLAQSAFYSQGNSNTLSTIDVSAGFIGLDSYQPILAGMLMIINTYSLYSYWMLMLFVRLNEKYYHNNSWNHAFNGNSFIRREDSENSSVNQTCDFNSNLKLSSLMNSLLTVRFMTISFFMCVAIMLKNHLFIWSVLCPKLLYEACLTAMLDVISLVVAISALIE